MFRGLTAITIDNKGRMVIPTRYRGDLLKDVFEIEENRNNSDPIFPIVVTIDPEFACLLLYPMQAWELIEAKLQELSSFNPVSRRMQRLLLGHATELELDTNGRILIPPLLRDYAGLKKEVVLVGQGKKFEIWDEATWHENRATWLSSTQQNDLPDELQRLSL